MFQCDQHERVAQVARDFGWQLWEYGIDSSCVVGGEAPHLALIWLKPCAWDEDQLIPVGCHCCTDIYIALWDWHQEQADVIDSRLIQMGKQPIQAQESTSARGAEVLSAPPSFLKPYRAR